jgi:hypothetical protein
MTAFENESQLQRIGSARSSKKWCSGNVGRAHKFRRGDVEHVLLTEKDQIATKRRMSEAERRGDDRRSDAAQHRSAFLLKEFERLICS